VEAPESEGDMTDEPDREPEDKDELAARRRKQAWNEYRSEIRDLLNETRPARVDENDKNWREDAYTWARLHLPYETELVRRVARNEVDRQEGHATKRANEILRDYWQGRIPFEWSMAGPWPIRVDGVRIRLDAAVPADVDKAAGQLALELQKTHEAGQAAVNAMRFLAQAAIRQGVDTVAKIGDLPLRNEDQAAGE
jgi:hypothetical protein